MTKLQDRTQYDTAALVTYNNVKLPNRTLLEFISAVGWSFTSLVGVTALIQLGLLVGFLGSPNYWQVDPVPRVLILSGTIILVLILMFALVPVNERLERYFKTVRQGYVLDQRTARLSDGGFNHYLTLYGYTYANELVTYETLVGPKTWRDSEVGRLVDLRQE